MVIAITMLVIIDVVRIDFRGETYVEYSKTEQMFGKPEYIQVIDRTFLSLESQAKHVHLQLSHRLQWI